MNDNGERKAPHNRSQLPCMYCGLPSDLDCNDVVLELLPTLPLRDAVSQVWHRYCYDDVLDEGEET